MRSLSNLEYQYEPFYLRAKLGHSSCNILRLLEEEREPLVIFILTTGESILSNLLVERWTFFLAQARGHINLSLGTWRTSNLQG